MEKGIDTGIISKERVKEHGEVFTPDSIVNDMLDLTDRELDTSDLWKYIRTTYLEPSCGNGNFLIRILDRKLQAVQKLDKSQQELGLVQALCSIYGIDIQNDNVLQSRKRMKDLIVNGSIEILELPGKEKAPFRFEKITLSPEIEKVVDYILEENIKLGNTLQPGELTVSEYNWTGDTVTRRELYFANLTDNGATPAKEYCPVKFNEIASTNATQSDYSDDFDW